MRFPNHYPLYPLLFGQGYELVGFLLVNAEQLDTSLSSVDADGFNIFVFVRIQQAVLSQCLYQGFLVERKGFSLILT